MLGAPHPLRGEKRSSAVFSKHPDEHRPERPVLLAVDQQLGEGFASADSRVEADVARHKSGLATEPLPSRIHEKREHHQPRDNGYVKRDSLPRQHPARYSTRVFVPHGD